MGVRAQFLFSRNCLSFISVTGEELALIVEEVGRQQLFRFDCHQTSVVFGKKLGAAVIGKQRECNNRRAATGALFRYSLLLLVIEIDH
jgi:3-oxoacyl-[acyl-carrier-protein] synthase III